MNERVAYFKIDGKQIGLSSADLEKNPNAVNLNISFDVVYQGNTLVPLDAKFSIMNITQKKMQQIVTNNMLYIKQKRPRRKIEFWAGYKGYERLLFKGEIYRAWFSGKPDTTLFIDAWSSLSLMGAKVDVKYQNIKMIDLLKDAAENKCKMKISASKTIKQHPQLQRVVSNFSYSGSCYEYLRRVIKDITGNYSLLKNQILISCENNVVYIKYSQKNNTKTPISVGVWSGMIGRPEPIDFGVVVKMMLNPNFYVGQTIELSSLEDTWYDGLYNIQETRFYGNTRDEEYYTELKCQIIDKVE